MHSDQDQDNRGSSQLHDEAGLEKDRLEKRTQRDQEARSKQALSNQGSQDRKPARPIPITPAATAGNKPR